MIECVPNFSEGRDRSKLEAIVAAITSVPGVFLLGQELDPDHHRSVVTFAGESRAVVEGAVRGVEKAKEVLDLSAHAGEHPRVGVADVVPFVPLAGSTMDDARKAARTAGRELWDRLGVPVYFYGAAALNPDRVRLEKTRRLGFDGKPPDIGRIASHATAGAVMVGARDFLVAYNIQLATKDVKIAREIARRVRESSGGIRHVKAIGLYLDSLGVAQVSMNLVNYRETDLMAVWNAVAQAAEELGTQATEGEMIGLVPREAYEQAPEFFQKAPNFDPATRVIENRLEALKNPQ